MVWHLNLQGISEKLRGKALTSNQNFNMQKENPSMLWNRKQHSHQHALHKDTTWPEPCQRIAFHHRIAQKGNIRTQPNWPFFSLISPRRWCTGRNPQLMNNLL